MGELIKKVGSVTIDNNKFDIELNHSSNGSSDREIHLQNPHFRLALSEKQFCKMATCVLLARKQLHQIKGIEKK